ncbi:hypothetical protein RF11_04427 [Thelohanellus kitauei]|uniref:Uncharacterized protein n=1 Tax=Thelohanellus kitauei TaxID=669202 RepID=A0A0C2IXR0_THEKT|nr:hypothetical protein RF11_04427 [Thelohanellus kitauei]
MACYDHSISNLIILSYHLIKPNSNPQKNPESIGEKETKLADYEVLSGLLNQPSRFAERDTVERTIQNDEGDIRAETAVPQPQRSNKPRSRKLAALSACERLKRNYHFILSINTEIESLSSESNTISVSFCITSAYILNISRLLPVLYINK